MKKTIIAIAIIGLAAIAWAQVSVDVDIALPKIVMLVIGNGGRVTYDLNARTWGVDIDAVNELGETTAYKSVSVNMEDVYLVLEKKDPSVNWREKTPLLIDVIKALAVQGE